MPPARQNLEQTPIAHVLARKPARILLTISPESPVREAAARMYEHGVGSLLVVEGARVLGLLTDRDCTRHLARGNPTELDLQPVRRLMTPRVVVVEPSYTVSQCLAIMVDRRVRHLPVIEDVTVVGLVSRGDLVRFLVGDERGVFEDLSDYILDVQPGMPIGRAAHRSHSCGGGRYAHP